MDDSAPPAEAGADIAASLGQDAPPKPTAPTLSRRLDGSWLGGVCVGLSARLGWPVALLRAAFMAAGLWLFAGAVVYALLWLVLPRADRPTAVGLAAASRGGLRQTPRTNVKVTAVQTLMLLVYGFGAAGLVNVLGSGWIARDAFSVVGVGAGVALVWRQWDRPRPADQVAAIWVARGKVVLGVVVAGTVLGLTLGWRLGWSALPRIALIVALGVGFAVVLAAPWLLHPRRASRDREEEVLLQAKADMAAHLHDSVLQTLAMIQRQAADAKAVAHLARRQERELRTWLYGEAGDAETVKVALRAVAAEVEDAFSVRVDLVTVGDAELSPELDALVRAAREAIVNAAKHSGADRVDVYAEVAPNQAEVFVRDRGQGFQADQIGPDRMGVRRSILDRMHRYGGVVGLRSTVGEGTEVRLQVDR
ncbi:MAG: PspC domain-containing protein [Propionibacteriaceae bacterium]|jgi:signal transduction histidine kinase|nr:PspC domain-containing protein [Propionibacteriaceae bacterium]